MTLRRTIRFALATLLAAAALPATAARAADTPVPATVTLVGSLQSELGCPGDWQPECAATHLQPVAGRPEVFQATFDVPAGGFEYKVALNGSWDENYGAGGTAGGANLPLTAPGGPITFTYDHRTHLITDSLPKPVTAEKAAHWVRRDLIAWNVSGTSYRLFWGPDGGLVNADGTITGGSSIPLRLDPAGLPAPVVLKFPQLAAYRALTVPASAPIPSI